MHHALEQLPASLRNQLIDTYLAIPGLSFNPNAVNPRKTVQHYFESFLYHQLNIVIWHDVINNSVSRHRSNNFNRLSEDKLVAILKRYNAKTSAIAYCQRTEIEEIFEKFKESGILTISMIDDLTSKRKAKDKRLRK